MDQHRLQNRTYLEETPCLSARFVESIIKKKSQRFSLAQKLCACIISGGEIIGNENSEKRALALLYHVVLPKISVVLSDLGYFPRNSRKLIVDAEHALTAKCVLGESGRVFSKMKRACRVATKHAVQFPDDAEVVRTESSKNIGATPRIMTKGGGRFNTLDEILERYLMSQTYVVKAGDIFFRNPDENNEVQSLSIFQNDAAEMCFERNCLGAVLMFVPHCELGNNSTHFFQDPELLIDVAIMDCKEDLTVVQYMLREVFKTYNPEKRYDVICGCNEYDESEGLFPERFNKPLVRKNAQ